MHQQTITTNKKCTNTTLTLTYNLMQYNHRIRKNGQKGHSSCRFRILTYTFSEKGH